MVVRKIPEKVSILRNTNNAEKGLYFKSLSIDNRAQANVARVSFYSAQSTALLNFCASWQTTPRWVMYVASFPSQCCYRFPVAEADLRRLHFGGQRSTENDPDAHRYRGW